jgi:hypothetical protein
VFSCSSIQSFLLVIGAYSGFHFDCLHEAAQPETGQSIKAVFIAVVQSAPPDTDPRTFGIAIPEKQKPRRGGGAKSKICNKFGGSPNRAKVGTGVKFY